jgi:hypothetical protein
MKIADCRLEKMESVNRKECIGWGKWSLMKSVSLRPHSAKSNGINFALTDC